MRSTSTWLWWWFFLDIALTLFYVLGPSIGLNFSAFRPMLHSLVFYLPALLVLWHLSLTLSMRRGLTLLGLAAGIGWLAEAVSLRVGAFFGGLYVYHPVGTMLAGVPLIVVLYWAVFIYTGYNVTTSFLVWQGKPKPQRLAGNWRELVLLVLLDGLAVTAIDLFMDPIQVHVGTWHWLNGGVYFGVPLGNFLGWFLVTVAVTGLFRGWEYLKPRPSLVADRSVYLIPVLGYGVLGISFLVSALEHQMYTLAVVGGIGLWTVWLSNLFLIGHNRTLTKS
jgi:uncharacterized membrane protein